MTLSEFKSVQDAIETIEFWDNCRTTQEVHFIKNNAHKDIDVKETLKNLLKIIQHLQAEIKRKDNFKKQLKDFLELSLSYVEGNKGNVEAIEAVQRWIKIFEEEQALAEQQLTGASQ